MVLADEGEGWECEGYHGEKLHHVTQLKCTFELEYAQELRNNQCASFWKAGAETEAHWESFNSVFLFTEPTLMVSN